MRPVAAAPDVTEMATEAIRTHRRHLASGSQYSSHDVSPATVGRFGAVAGAVVDVELNIRFSKRRGNGAAEENTVRFAAIAQCTGHGCIDPTHEVVAAGSFLLDADADETAPAALPPVDSALAWAQQHAEVCRALPRSATV